MYTYIHIYRLKHIQTDRQIYRYKKTLKYKDIHTFKHKHTHTLILLATVRLTNTLAYFTAV